MHIATLVISNHKIPLVISKREVSGDEGRKKPDCSEFKRKWGGKYKPKPQ